MTWIPFGVDAEAHSVLADGTPDWMLNSLEELFLSEFRLWHRGHNGGGWHVDRLERIRRMELGTRMRPFAKLVESKSVSAMFVAMTPEERLRAIDWAIKDNVANRETGNDKIEDVLREGGSKWKVGIRNGAPGLEERVPQGVQDAADAAMALAGDAGRLLSEAWHAVYGISPQPDLGYRKSIEAVEAVALPKVMPHDATATLGKAIGQMRAQGDWMLPFIKEHKQNPSQEVVLGMIQALWSGHSDRHPGTQSYIHPVHAGGSRGSCLHGGYSRQSLRQWQHFASLTEVKVRPHGRDCASKREAGSSQGHSGRGSGRLPRPELAHGSRVSGSTGL